MRGGFGLVVARSPATASPASVSGEQGPLGLARLEAMVQRSSRDPGGAATPAGLGPGPAPELDPGVGALVGPLSPDLAIQRFLESTTSSDPQGTSGDDGGPSAPVGASSGPISAELLERIIDALEERVLHELERRGLRHNPEVF